MEWVVMVGAGALAYYAFTKAKPQPPPPSTETTPVWNGEQDDNIQQEVNPVQVNNNQPSVVFSNYILEGGSISPAEMLILEELFQGQILSGTQQEQYQMLANYRVSQSDAWQNEYLELKLAR